jgi:hypothetical protein
LNKTRATMLFTAVLLFCSAFIAYANASDGYTYNLTSASGDAPQLNQPFIVTATTDNPNVGNIRFTWINPAGQTVFTETVSTTKIDSNKVANSTCTINSLGDWTVKTEYMDFRNFIAFTYCNTVETRTTFNVVPEVPLLGTAGIAIAMVAGFVFYKKRSPT